MAQMIQNTPVYLKPFPDARAERLNRVSQSEFRCRFCGHGENADLNAARNIRLRAVVNQPIVVCQRVLELELQAHPFRGG